ncbi:hypothetical protein [Microbulbifer variabilis]|uniref:hypothetical protein n=1 Tax=Microbulbifer variabilis TaxID=266805 RepID=UPI001CFCE685|nr:hypothetical protein [Microbulbifer variabilis]
MAINGVDILKGLFKLVSASVLLGVSTYLTLQKLPVKMGLSIVAGALGLAFSNLDKIGEFKGAGFSAKMVEQVEAIVEKETEEQVVTTRNKKVEEELDFLEFSRTPVVSHYPAQAIVSSSLSNETSIIQALLNSKYTWRTVSGLANGANIGSKEVVHAIDRLVGRGLVRSSEGRGGPIYVLTANGRTLAKSQKQKFPL